jgi:hypothetical protein
MLRRVQTAVGMPSADFSAEGSDTVGFPLKLPQGT